MAGMGMTLSLPLIG